MTAPTFFTVTADYLPSTDKGTIWGTLEFTMLIASGDTLAIPSLDTIIVPVVTQASLSKGVLVDTTGNPGVELLANAAAVGLSGALYYQVTFNQVWYQAPGEAPVEMPLNTFTFQAPTTGTTVDLSTVTPAAGVVAAQIYATTIPGPGLVKSTGSALATAVSGTDYAPATTGSSLLKANGAGGFAAAVPGADYFVPGGGAADSIHGGTLAAVGPGPAFSGGTLSSVGLGPSFSGGRIGPQIRYAAAPAAPTPPVGSPQIGLQRSIIQIGSSVTLPTYVGTDIVAIVLTGGVATLPTAVGNTNTYTIKNATGTTLSVPTTSGQTIDGSTGVTIPANTSLVVVSDNANWWVI